MRATFLGIHSSDIPNLESWSPGDEPFGFSLMIFVRPNNTSTGDETFHVNVCSPSWFEAQMAGTNVQSGWSTIFMKRYDYRELLGFIEKAVHRAEGDTWKDVARSLGWLGRWEFEGYTP